jgi:hypothetical protein
LRPADLLRIAAIVMMVPVMVMPVVAGRLRVILVVLRKSRRRHAHGHHQIAKSKRGDQRLSHRRNLPWRHRRLACDSDHQGQENKPGAQHAVIHPTLVIKHAG